MYNKDWKIIYNYMMCKFVVFYICVLIVLNLMFSVLIGVGCDIIVMLILLKIFCFNKIILLLLFFFFGVLIMDNCKDYD